MMNLNLVLVKLSQRWWKCVRPTLCRNHTIGFYNPNPGLHPDGYADVDSGWPRVLKHFATEAWRRVEAGEITEDELYQSDSQWCGLYDRMHTHEPDEMERRLALAADYGESLNHDWH
jgi:hypothetical protein